MVKEKKVVKKETAKKEENKEKVVKSVEEEKIIKTEEVKKSKKTDKKNVKKLDVKKKEKKNVANSSKTTLRSEFNKIKWPSKKEMVKYSVAVIIFIIFCALFFWAIQLIMAGLMKLI